MTTRAKLIGPARFSVAVHALAGLASNGGTLSSAMLAAQVHSHPTFLRRILATLASHKIVDTREGRDGGYTLRMPADQLTLSAIYLAIRIEQPIHELSNADGIQDSQKANQRLSNIMKGAEQQVIDYLQQFTLADIIEDSDDY
ncbi:Rrf2 family transcriptional regulator [Paenibacillus kyungheensis]|uniref:Rrf2 family transcriptional regulator n=1 Tax=Paenibacillus kyungheensis TaxID=1452732 RepID=A0AAX3LZ04_9BACL|nr:Rrf2 family transcriptional regulator [Paenibacillus kyungheensis]WCT55202.1 Rrf2 family transcriptional regulator [Paenibacillus kyungheensis]